jgi:hypothetical protein
MPVFWEHRFPFIGMMQYPMPVLAGVVLSITFVVVVACIVLEYKRFRYDGYRAAHGYNLKHPFNKEREHL